MRPAADTLNRPVRSLFTPPERSLFKPAPLWEHSNSLNYGAFDIRTKMAAVRLPRRKWSERDEKRPEMALAAAARGSDKWQKNPRSAGFRLLITSRKRMSPTGRLAEGSLLAANILFAGVRCPANGSAQPAVRDRAVSQGGEPVGKVMLEREVDAHISLVRVGACGGWIWTL